MWVGNSPWPMGISHSMLPVGLRIRLQLFQARQGGSAKPGNTEATVSFKAPTSNGGSPITSYTVISSPGGIIAKGAGSPSKK